MQHWWYRSYQVCSNDDLIDLDLFYSKVKFSHLGFCMGKRQNSEFSDSVVACDIKVDLSVCS